MAPSLSGKQRASRIELDYHARPDRLVTTKRFLCRSAIAATAVYLSWGFLAPGRSETAFSPGPVAQPHATWDSKCSACHEPFVPVRGDAWAAAWLDPVSEGTSPGGRLSDQKCQRCHAAAEHHSRQKPAEVQGCASCHFEHRGRLAVLTKLDDRSCTNCHQHLSLHLAGTPQFQDPPLGDVTRFDQLHPEFRSLKSDPGAMKFSHARHMRAGLKASDKDKFEFTLANIPKADRARYRDSGQADSSQDRKHLVQLQCATCHQTETADAPSRSAGDYMLPVTYAKDCKACHPLSLPPGSAEQVEHGRTPEQLTEILASRFWDSYLQQHPELAGRDIARLPLPGQSPEPEAIEAAARVKEWVAGAERHLRVVCHECHEPQNSADPDGGLAALRPSNIPATWLRHARFNHAPHRALQCSECHAAAATSQVHTDVLIAGRETCVKCHSPARADGELGGAGYGCAECHRYHGGPEPRHGAGIKSPAATVDHTLLQFLRGDPKTP